MKKPGFISWTIEIQVHESIVMDGFNIETKDDIVRMLQARLPFAYGIELGGKVIKKPDAKYIAILQGVSGK